MSDHAANAAPVRVTDPSGKTVFDGENVEQALAHLSAHAPASWWVDGWRVHCAPDAWLDVPAIGFDGERLA